MRILWTAAAALSFALPTIAHAHPVQLGGALGGPEPTVLDGNTLGFGPLVVYLYGVDAPAANRSTWPGSEELNGQSCKRGESSWQCGDEAMHALRDLIGESAVRCRVVKGMISKTNLTLQGGVDWVTAVCWTEPDYPAKAELPENPRFDMSLNARMVRAGHALTWAHSDHYYELETEARKACRGIHSGPYVPPWLWDLGIRQTRHAARCVKSDG